MHIDMVVSSQVHIVAGLDMSDYCDKETLNSNKQNVYLKFW